MFTSPNIVTVTTDTFEQEVLKADRMVVVDFWGTQCGPCRMIKPHYERLANEYGDVAKFVAINIEDNKTLAKELGLRSMPTFRIYSGGNVIMEATGAPQFPVLENAIKVRRETLQYHNRASK
jgi:thioredoxin 1